MSERPQPGDADYRLYAILFNDITHAPVEDYMPLNERHVIADHLWAQGWRREIRDEDITERPRPPELSHEDLVRLLSRKPQRVALPPGEKGVF